jgi:hypothetical protein
LTTHIYRIKVKITQYYNNKSCQGT